jgi:hypothetical protein
MPAWSPDARASGAASDPDLIGVVPSAMASPQEAGDVDFHAFSESGMATSPLSRHRRRGLVAGLVAAGGAAVLVVSLVVVLGGGTSAEGVVLHAVNSAMADRTAHIAINLNGKAGGAAITSSGTGSIDFNQNAVQLQMPVSAGGQQVDLQLLYLGGTMYEGIPGLDQLEPGKSWISIDTSAISQSVGVGSTGSLGVTNNPAAMLRLLAQNGNTVTSLGASTIDGIGVQGYAVIISQSQMRSELANAKLPEWIRQAISKVNFNHLNYKVYVDSQGLLRREALAIQMTVASHSIAMNETLDFSDFGTPVSISAPPPDQVVSIQQFLQDAQQVQNSTQS